jgi:threonine-phosphate decarboxylase
MTALAPLHGGQLQQIAERFGIAVSELIDFSANINPEGPPAAVLPCLRASLENPSILTHYPDLDEKQLRQSLAHYAGVRPESVAVANGFVPLLDATLRILVIQSCVVPVPAFVEYRKVLERSLVEMIPDILTAESAFNYDATSLLTGSHQAILLANPQNPSGILSPRPTMLRIAEEAARRNIFVLLDEAFIDFCPDASLVCEIDRLPNLIVFRSVTKFFGIAGLRVAYAAANPELCKRIQQAIAPWSVTTLASVAVSTAVRNEAYARHSIALNSERRDHLETGVRQVGIHVYPSAANFLLLRLPASVDGQQFWERLICKHHIVLRNCANYEALSASHLRAAVRTSTENERLIEALSYEAKKVQSLIGIASQCE